MEDVITAIRTFNEQESALGLNHTKDKLLKAKTEFGKAVNQYYPDWIQAINDPVSHQKKQIDQSLQNLRIKQKFQEENFQKRLRIHQEIIESQQLYMNEITQNQLVQAQREQLIRQTQKKEDEMRERIKTMQTQYVRDYNFTPSVNSLQIDQELHVNDLEKPRTSYQPPVVVERPQTNPSQVRIQTPDSHLPAQLQFSSRNKHIQKDVPVQFTEVVINERMPKELYGSLVSFGDPQHIKPGLIESRISQKEVSLPIQTIQQPYKGKIIQAEIPEQIDMRPRPSQPRFKGKFITAQEPEDLDMRPINPISQPKQKFTPVSVQTIYQPQGKTVQIQETGDFDMRPINPVTQPKEKFTPVTAQNIYQPQGKTVQIKEIGDFDLKPVQKKEDVAFKPKGLPNPNRLKAQRMRKAKPIEISRQEVKSSPVTKKEFKKAEQKPEKQFEFIHEPYKMPVIEQEGKKTGFQIPNFKGEKKKKKKEKKILDFSEFQLDLPDETNKHTSPHPLVMKSKFIDIEEDDFDNTPIEILGVQRPATSKIETIKQWTNEDDEEFDIKVVKTGESQIDSPDSRPIVNSEMDVEESLEDSSQITSAYFDSFVSRLDNRKKQ